MKKTFVIMACLAVATSSFAYYDSYSRSSADSLSFIGFIMLITGILEIILFFKIWGMTNNIKALKKDHFNETKLDSLTEKCDYLTKNLILGKKENVKTMLLMIFMQNLEKSYTSNKDSIRPYVDNLKTQFDKIGEELPPYISKMETYGDYYHLFTAKDFKIEKDSK